MSYRARSGTIDTMTGTTALIDADGKRLDLDAYALDSIVNVLSAQYPDGLVALSDGVVDQDIARQCGAALYDAPVAVVERDGRRVIVHATDGGTDPVVAFVARLAEQIGDDALADTARQRLLQQAGAGTTPSDTLAVATVRQWAQYLLEARGPITVVR